MTDFKALLGSSVQITATVEKIVVSRHSNNEMILLNDIYVNGEFYRDHGWVKKTKRLSVVAPRQKFSAAATLIKYFDTSSNKEDKLGFKSFRNVVVKD